MKSKLGFTSITLLAINAIMGAGIFLTPGTVVKMVGTRAIYAYIIAAIVAAILALTFASAAKYVRKSGAAYSYTKTAFGDAAGFYMDVIRFFSATIAWGVAAVSVVRTLYALFNVQQTFLSITIGFLLLVLVMTLFNIFGTRVFMIANNLSTIAKVLVLVFIIIMGAITLIVTGQNHFNDLNNMKSIPQLTTTNFFMAIITAFYAFTGFESVGTASEDMIEPEKNLPRAIPLAFLIIVLVYVSTITVAMMLDPSGLINTNKVIAIAVIFNNPVTENIIMIGAIIAMLGSNIAAPFNIPRILEAMAKEGQMPSIIAKRTSFNFPLVAYIITVILAVGVPMSFQYSLPFIIVISATVRFAEFLVIPVGVIKFYRGTNVEPILNAKKNLFTDVIIPIIAVIASVIILINYDWAGEFSLKVNGKFILNWYAIWGMIFGFVILPVALYVLNYFEKKSKLVKK